MAPCRVAMQKVTLSAEFRHTHVIIILRGQQWQKRFFRGSPFGPQEPETFSLVAKRKCYRLCAGAKKPPTYCRDQRSALTFTPIMAADSQPVRVKSHRQSTLNAAVIAVSGAGAAAMVGGGAVIQQSIIPN